jgi:hypothetical protein
MPDPTPDAAPVTREGDYLADRFEWAAPGDQQEDAWLVRFCDKDCGEAIFTGLNAEAEARAYWNRYAPSYNIYVFRLARLAAEAQHRERAEMLDREADVADHEIALLRERAEKAEREPDEARERSREFAEVAMGNAGVIGQHEITIALAGNELDKAGVPHDDHGDEEDRDLTLAQRCELLAHYYHEELNRADEAEAALLASEQHNRALVERDAKVAECAFDDRPRSRVGHPSQMDWDDGYRDGTQAAAQAIRALLPAAEGERGEDSSTRDAPAI